MHSSYSITQEARDVVAAELLKARDAIAAAALALSSTMAHP